MTMRVLLIELVLWNTGKLKNEADYNLYLIKSSILYF